MFSLVQICSQGHRVPINAIPCLNYRMALDKERQFEENKTADTTADATADDTTTEQVKCDESLLTSTAQVQDGHNNKPDEVTPSEETTCKNCFFNVQFSNGI